MKKAFLILLLLPLSVVAQNSGLTGRVVDAETGKPIPYAKVTHTLTGEADRDGNYTVHYRPEDSDLRVFVSHHNYYTDTFSAFPGTVWLRPLPKDSIQRRNDKNFHENQRERMQQAKTDEERARIYYQDFIYCNFGYTNPYFPYPEWDENTELRTPTFPHSADSALAILYSLYWQEGKEYLYYPIVQLEHYLGFRHDEAIVPPDTSEYYVPMQSGAHNANLGPGWETDYSQHLLLYTERALQSCQSYTYYFRQLKEPDLWHMRGDTAIRMLIDHLPGSGSTLIRVDMEKGHPTAHKYSCYRQYSSRSHKYHLKVYQHDKIRLTPEQWQEVLHLADTIDSLPWKGAGSKIDGNWYFFEYRHGDSYRSHYTCSDNIRLSDYLWELFVEQKRKKRQ
ncbi:MAG: carboxypeptidase regulatory-like domain-containing protein [Bacteroidales bacterium]|nr:carboxypeptidase regulatory-like domain-containing protein [Bacteroidales bacterium]